MANYIALQSGTGIITLQSATGAILLQSDVAIPAVAQLSDSAPFRRKQIGSVDLIPNLLLTTLAVAVVSLPPGARLDTSAPRIKRQVQSDVYQRPLTLGINPNPDAVELSASAPARKGAVYVGIDPNRLPLIAVVVSAPFIPVDTAQVQRKAAVWADQPSRPITLGINPNPDTRSADSSAPQRKLQVTVDVYPNLTLTTLAGVIASPFTPLDTSRAQPKRAVWADVPQRPITLGINPNPAAIALDRSAPRIKYQVQVDLYPNLQTNTLTPAGILPPGQQLTESAPPRKSAVYAFQQHNTLAAGINPNPASAKLDSSAPRIKYQPQVDFYPNLATTTLAPQPAFLVVEPFMAEREQTVFIAEVEGNVFHVERERMVFLGPK